MRVQELEQRNKELLRDLESRAGVVADLRQELAAQRRDKQTEEQPAVAVNETYVDQLLATQSAISSLFRRTGTGRRSATSSLTLDRLQKGVLALS